MDPSPIPKFDNPKLTDNPAIQLVRRGARTAHLRPAALYARLSALISMTTRFEATKAAHDCDLCGAEDSYLDEVITDDQGGRMFVCSDTDFCAGRRATGLKGRLWRAAEDRRARHDPDAKDDRRPTSPLLAGRRPDQALRRPHRLRRMSPSTFTLARCWASSAKAARANPRCSPALPATCARCGRVVFDTSDGPRTC